MSTFVYETFNFTLNPHPNTVARSSLFCGNTERKPFPGLWVFVGNTCVSATLKPPDCPQFSGNDHVSCGSNNTVCFCLFPGNSASSWGEGQAFKDCDWSMFPSARIRLKQFLCVLCRLQCSMERALREQGEKVYLLRAESDRHLTVIFSSSSLYMSLFWQFNECRAADAALSAALTSSLFCYGTKRAPSFPIASIRHLDVITTQRHKDFILVSPCVFMTLTLCV